MIQIMHSFDGLMPPPEVLERVRDGRIAAFCLFSGKNIESPEQLYQLTSAIRAAARDGGQPIPLIGTDQEGGQLIAISGGTTQLPGNMALGATRSEDLAERAGRVLGKELLAMGVNVNFAPTLDVNVNPENPVIGVRAFADDPTLVSKLGAAMIRGMQAEGIIATGKHFPGHGDTSTDSHHALPQVPHKRTRLNEVELPPFRAAIEANVGALITSHVIYTALDEAQPATLSRPILTDLLRNQLGFEGLIITDAMDMHAVAQFGKEASVKAALQAGCDLVLLGHLSDQLALSDALVHEQQADSVTRIRQIQAQLSDERPPFEIIGSKDHQAVAQTIADLSITVVRDINQRIPIALDEETTLGLVTIIPRNLTPADTSAQVELRLEEAIHKRHPRIQTAKLPYGGTENDVQDVLAQVANANTIIVATIGAERDPSQAALVRALHQRGVSPIVVSLRTPYDIMAFPEIETYLCAYGIRDVTTEAIARVLFGEIQASGTLPCTIPGLRERV